MRFLFLFLSDIKCSNLGEHDRINKTVVIYGFQNLVFKNTSTLIDKATMSIFSDAAELPVFSHKENEIYRDRYVHQWSSRKVSVVKPNLGKIRVANKQNVY